MVVGRVFGLTRMAEERMMVQERLAVEIQHYCHHQRLMIRLRTLLPQILIPVVQGWVLHQIAGIYEYMLLSILHIFV